MVWEVRLVHGSSEVMGDGVDGPEWLGKVVVGFHGTVLVVME